MNEPFVRDLELLIASHHQVLLINTFEHDRAALFLKSIADKMGIPFFTWKAGRGLCRSDETTPVYGTQFPALAMAFIEKADQSAIYHFYALSPLEDRELIQKLTDAAKQFFTRNGAIVISDGDLEIPKALAQWITPVQWPNLGVDDFRQLYQSIIKNASSRMAVKVLFDEKELTNFFNGLKGLTLVEVQQILTRAVLEKGQIGPEILRDVANAKKAVVEHDGLLEFFPEQQCFEDIAGLDGLKSWLSKRKELLKSPDTAAKYHLPFPKGILLIGVQGCGKSMCAKAVAKEWGLPLVKLDPSKLFDKFIGESEKNFNRALASAERLAPVILWIDELEKAFSQSGTESDGGTEMRILGTFLSWLQDRSGDVFVVATANDIQRLPPEFVRKGRFDEIFFLDLPKADARKKIFEIHLKNHGQDSANFNLPSLVKASEGFSGAEIEQSVISALYTAINENKPLSDAILTKEISLTRPLSVTMSEKVNGLREWASDRAVNAN